MSSIQKELVVPANIFKATDNSKKYEIVLASF